jgi:predicted AlkP superfamily phosphohydrolase/phosphomutase
VSKLVILGIDALDPVLLEKWQDELPNFHKIMTQGYFARLESTTPPDSIPAWVTIYTGMHPWHHGIIGSVDYLEIRGGAPALDTNLLIGKTFWDKASETGRRVCVVNPLLAYPVWPVNGIMVNGPVFVTGEVQAYPPEILEQYELPEMGGMVDFPGKRELGAFIRRTEYVTRDQARFGLELLDREEWDLFFLQFLTLDRVMHFLWRYTDPTDPTFPGSNPLEHSIKDFFKLFDSILGDFLDRLTPGQSLLIVSDHGHAMRPPKAVYVNEMLRRQGLLKTRESRVPGFNTVALVEKTKNLFLRLMQRLDLEDLTYRIAALIPKERRKSLKTSAYAVTRADSIAWVSDIGGGTSFSGIEINRALCEDKDYEPLRDRLISLLASFTDERGDRIVKWAKRREDAFTGPNVGKYPDVVFELSPEHGVDRTLYCGEVGASSTHKKISGGHSKFGTLMLYGSGAAPQERDLHISSVFDMIRRTLGLQRDEKEP